MANPANPTHDDFDEPKRDHRVRVLKGGTVMGGNQSSDIGCTLRNQHEGGAELKIALDTWVPDHFLLYVPLDGLAYRCVVRWRRGDRLGVQFTGTEPKPRAHYG